MITFSKNEKIFFTALSLFAVIFMFVKYIEMPEITRIKAALKKYDDTVSYFENSGSLKEKIEDLNRYIESAEKSMKGIPENIEVSEIIRYIDNVQKAQGLKPGRLIFSEADSENSEAIGIIKSAGLKTLCITYDTAGEYSRLMALVSDIENCEISRDICRLSLNKGGQEGVFNLSIDIKCYYFAA